MAQAPVLVEDRWDPLTEELKTFTKRHAQEVDKYVKKLEKRARQNGFARTSRKHETEHFTWLAERVVLKRSPREIARRLRDIGDGKTEPTDKDVLEAERKRVDEAVRETAKLVGINLPPLRRLRSSAPRKD